MKQTFEIPDGCNRVTIEQRDRQIITTFEPDFKDGDIIYCKDMMYEYVFIFKSLSDNKHNPFWCYVSLGLTDESDDKVNYNHKVRGSEDIIRVATKSEEQQLFDALAKEGKRWNAESKRVEDIKRKMPLALVGKAVEAIKIIAIRSADQWLRAKRLCIQLLRIKRPSP